MANGGPISRRRFLAAAAFFTGALAFVLNELKPSSVPTAAARPGSSGLPSAKTGAAPAKAQATAKAAALPEYPVVPYISKAIHLDALPWGAQSFYKQPWRGYLETVAGSQFLSGIGINYNAPSDANHAAVMKLLADSGFRSIRVEVGWSSVDWSETTLVQRVALQTVFAACKSYGVTPVILLNANHGGPCPAIGYARKVLGGGQAGSTQVQLDSVADLVPAYSGLSNLSASWMAEALITSVNPLTNTVHLSKPLPKALPNGTPVRVDTLKYSPLYPVGTPQFEQTAAGWLRYTKLVLDLVRASGLPKFEVEVWNELTFGSNFLNINNYYQPPVAQFVPSDPLNLGGQDWELGKRTVDFIKPNYPSAKVLWGFSNTTFFHTAVRNLPPGTDGQSYHPYGTSKSSIPRDFPPKARYGLFVEHFIPGNLTWCMPEGWAHLGTAMEYLMRLLNPWNRLTDRPKQTSDFRHYMTEHGFMPREAGITDRNQALTYKAKCVTRALLFWLNKGLTKMDIYCAYDRSDQGMGMLFAQPAPKEYASYAEQQLMSPALQGIKNVVGQFAGSQPLAQVRQLGVDVTSLGPQPKVFDGDASHSPLYYREMFAFLPFQITSRKFICAMYVMSYDMTNPPPAMLFRINVKNVNGTGARISFYDPIRNQPLPLKVTARSGSQATVEIEAVEYPRLLVISE